MSETNQQLVQEMYPEVQLLPLTPLTEEEKQQMRTEFELELSEADHAFGIGIATDETHEGKPVLELLATGLTEEAAWHLAARRVEQLKNEPAV